MKTENESVEWFDKFFPPSKSAAIEIPWVVSPQAKEKLKALWLQELSTSKLELIKELREKAKRSHVDPEFKEFVEEILNEVDTPEKCQHDYDGGHKCLKCGDIDYSFICKQPRYCRCMS